MLNTEVVVTGGSWANTSAWSENFSIALVGALLISILTVWLFVERWALLRFSSWKMMQENGLVMLAFF